MKRLLLISAVVLYALYGHAQLVLPERDSANRDTISFYDYRINKDDRFTVIRKTKANEIVFEKPLTGRFLFSQGNGMAVDMELKDGVAVGDWQYYTSTFQGPIISSTVSFVDGYKHGTENIYSYEWNKETERFESYLRGVIDYDMGKTQHMVYYWPNNQISLECPYDKDGNRHGWYKYYYYEGTIEQKGEYIHGDRVGTWETFGVKGNIKKRNVHKDGFIHSTTYHANGKPNISKTTRNRVYEGDYLHLDERGDTLVYHFYKNGIEQGRQVASSWVGYYEPRSKAYYYTNEQGVIQGTYIQHFYDTGRLRVKGQYNNEGVRDGVWEYYLQDGRLYRSETLENGWQRASRTRWLKNKAGQLIDAQYHLESYPSGAVPKKEDEIPFALFSE